MHMNRILRQYKKMSGTSGSGADMGINPQDITVRLPMSEKFL
jgi:hypothetical protein